MDKKIAIFAFTFFLTFKLAIGQSYFYYKELGIKEGLTQSTVTSVLTDNRGYLWIGTENGLNRYDRDILKPYFHKKGDSRTLSDNQILFIAEDSLLNLWVATAKGLSLYDREKDNFTPILVADSKPLYIASYLLVEDGILFGGSGSIFKFVYATKKLEMLYGAQKAELYNPFWHMIKYDKEHILINSRWHGIFSFNLLTKEFKKLNAFNEKSYRCIFMDSRNRLWVSIYGKGVSCYQGETLVRHFTTDNSPLTYNVVNDIVEKDGELWLGTDGGGINIVSLDDFSFSFIRQVEDDLNSFPVNSIYSLYLDASANIWAGSVRKGLLGIKKVYSRSYQRVPIGNRYGLSNQTINSFYQDYKGKIWIGTDGGGINYFDPGSSAFKHYTTTKHEKIISIVDYSPNELLFFSFNKGLFVFDKQTGVKRPFILVNKEINDQNCKSGYSVFIAAQGDENIIFSGQQIIIYNKASNSFNVVASKGKDYVGNALKIIAVNKQSAYFADLNNLCAYDFVKKTFKTIYKGEYVINDASMGPDGSMWLATRNGFCYYNLKTGKLSLIETGLFQEARSVLADKHNRVWVGTSDKLYVYDISTHNFKTLDEVDGVSPNEYLPSSTLLTQNGDVLIGGTIGMTIIGSDIRFNTAKTEHSLELLDALLDGLPIVLGDKHKNLNRVIEVPWNFSSLQLKVLLNEGDVFRSNLFRFRIEGFDQGFVNQHANSLVVNHLPVGSYNIAASYYTRSGEWSADQQLLKIIVTPPWWRTFWFFLIVFIVFVSLILCFFYYYNRRKKRLQNIEIAIIKNKIAEDKVNFLTNISHELRTPLTLICAPLKRIIDRELDGEDNQKQLALVFQQAQQMKNIVNMVLDIRKIEEGKETLDIRPCQFNEWVLSVANKFVLEFENKNIEIVYELEDNIGIVSFDKNKCDFVLSNFLMNALKFSDPGSTTTVLTKMLEVDGMVEVLVKDQGIGLDTVQSNLLFSKFYQGKHEKGGSGIGLFYASNLIKYHKGRIGAFNNSEKGAVFYFQLPIIADVRVDSYQSLLKDVDSQINKPDIGDINYSNLKEASIVIVEDTSELRIYLKETLKSYFKKVYVAKSGEEALPMIKNKLPDVIASDLMMSDMNGFELCKKVKTDLDISHIPFLLMTAHNNSQNMHTGYKIGADAFLPKPFEIDDLLILIHNQLKLRQNIRERYQNDLVLTHHEVSFSNADETFLIKLNAIIIENMIDQKLNVDFLASNMNVSRSLLFNKVKYITGMGIVDYINKQRIERSIVLLTTTVLNINEITHELGFSSSRYFSTVFKSLKGETPSAYRKKITEI